jgi:ketosteroid isomerase-like protein
MRTIPGLILTIVLAAPLGWAETRSPAEQELVKLENDWSQAAMKRDGAALKQFYADEYVFTDSDGTTSAKTQEIANLSTGAFRLTAYKFEDMKVRVYGEVAVVTGRNTITGFWEDIKRDISGPYRFTDIFVKRNGRWQCVTSQSSRVVEKEKQERETGASN